MWDVAVAALTLITVLTLGPALLVDHLSARGWHRMPPRGDFPSQLVSPEDSGWRSWRLTAWIANRVDQIEGRLKLVAFIGAAAAAGIQLSRSF